MSLAGYRLPRLLYLAPGAFHPVGLCLPEGKPGTLLGFSPRRSYQLRPLPNLGQRAESNCVLFLVAGADLRLIPLKSVHLQRAFDVVT